MTTTSPLIIRAEALDRRLPGIDPFIFGAYHQDHYPRGNGHLGPDPALLAGRDIGMDFAGQGGWSMYHGDDVPGFPAHPHRGFETVTIVREGLVDHADSLGASARYGEGDVQWLTTGRGVQHGEMFPMVHQDRDNPLDLFQLWLNLPAKNKMADPDFTMFWGDNIPHFTRTDEQGRRSDVEVIAGNYVPTDGSAAVQALPPPPNSWASEPGADVAIWLITLDAGAELTLPAGTSVARRAIYLVKGPTLTVDRTRFDQRVMVEVQADQPLPISNDGAETATVLVLQGKPIGEPVVAQGPFVMTSQAEVMDAMRDFQRTEFGGWQWPSRAQTFGDAPRFAKHPDGRVEHPSA